ncbi:MAG: AraC family transcriptional regulator [Clostridia bacterium]|nr:AraC family transcriptional regulator [Clostridia bacterium]
MRESFSSLRQIEHHDNDLVRVYNNTQTDDYPAHWNNAFEIIVPIENAYEVCINDVVYDVREGEVLIIPAGSVHEIFAPESGRRYIIMADARLFYAVEGLAAVQHCFYPCVHLRYDRHGELLGEISDCLQKVVEGYSSEAFFSRAEARLWLSMLLIKVARSLMEGGQDGRSPGAHRQQTMAVFLDVCTYIADHCAKKLALEDVAAYSGYSKYHFARMFKAYSGMSFYDFFLRQRVLLCEQLLSDPQLSVTEVALRSGFGSIATFNRIFKQYEKMTPTEYRRLRQYVPGTRDPAEKSAISED